MQFNKHALAYNVVAWTETVGYAVHSLLPAEERVSHNF